MKKQAVVSALIYIGSSLFIAFLFILGTLGSNYSVVERFGGAFWVFILSNIILMPVVIPFIKRKLGE